jgi:hypothetical protein
VAPAASPRFLRKPGLSFDLRSPSRDVRAYHEPANIPIGKAEARQDRGTRKNLGKEGHAPSGWNGKGSRPKVAAGCRGGICAASPDE